MLSLVLDTATPALVVGLVDHPADPTPAMLGAGQVTVRAQQVRQDCRRHNEELMPTVLAVLEEAGASMSDIQRVVVGCGPGPFTGLRVGMASASALAHALGVPLEGVCSLDVIALATGASLVATDARRREVYFARYEKSGTRRVAGPEVAAPATVGGVEELISVPEHLSQALAATGPRVDTIIGAEFLACAPTMEVAPLYLRRPDAQVPKGL